MVQYSGGLTVLLAAIVTFSDPKAAWYTIILAGITGQLIGEAIIVLSTPNFLRRLVPSRLWMSFLTLFFGFVYGFNISIFTLLGVIAVSWLGLLSIIGMPVNLFLNKSRRDQGGAFVGDVEKNFIALCNQHAKEIGCELDWREYNRRTPDNPMGIGRTM